MKPSNKCKLRENSSSAKGRQLQKNYLRRKRDITNNIQTEVRF